MYIEACKMVYKLRALAQVIAPRIRPFNTALTPALVLRVTTVVPQRIGFGVKAIQHMPLSEQAQQKHKLKEVPCGDG